MGYLSNLFGSSSTPVPSTPEPFEIVASAEAVPSVEAAPSPIVVDDADKASPQQIDVVFSVDCTASMGPYIRAAQASCTRIMTQLSAAEGFDARFGLVAYRDHAPQDHTFVTRVFDFTSDAATFQQHVDWMRAQGGGDGPEAVAASLAACVAMPWRPAATFQQHVDWMS